MLLLGVKLGTVKQKMIKVIFGQLVCPNCRVIFIHQTKLCPVSPYVGDLWNHVEGSCLASTWLRSVTRDRKGKRGNEAEERRKAGGKEPENAEENRVAKRKATNIGVEGRRGNSRGMKERERTWWLGQCVSIWPCYVRAGGWGPGVDQSEGYSSLFLSLALSFSF